MSLLGIDVGTSGCKTVVFCEEGEVIAAEKETGGFLQIGFELRYSKLYQKAKEWIDQGLIGRVLNTHCTYFCSEFHLRDSWRSRSKGTLIGGRKVSSESGIRFL